MPFVLSAPVTIAGIANSYRLTGTGNLDDMWTALSTLGAVKNGADYYITAGGTKRLIVMAGTLVEQRVGIRSVRIDGKTHIQWSYGSSNNTTTLSAAAASGSKLIAVASAANIITGSFLTFPAITTGGENNSRFYRVDGVSGTNITLRTGLASAVASGVTTTITGSSVFGLSASGLRQSVVNIQYLPGAFLTYADSMIDPNSGTDGLNIAGFGAAEFLCGSLHYNHNDGGGSGTQAEFDFGAGGYVSMDDFSFVKNHLGPAHPFYGNFLATSKTSIYVAVGNNLLEVGPTNTNFPPLTTNTGLRIMGAGNYTINKPNFYGYDTAGGGSGWWHKLIDSAYLYTAGTAPNGFYEQIRTFKITWVTPAGASIGSVAVPAKLIAIGGSTSRHGSTQNITTTPASVTSTGSLLTQQLRQSSTQQGTSQVYTGGTTATGWFDDDPYNIYMVSYGYSSQLLSFSAKPAFTAYPQTSLNDGTSITQVSTQNPLAAAVPYASVATAGFGFSASGNGTVTIGANSTTDTVGQYLLKIAYDNAGDVFWRTNNHKPVSVSGTQMDLGAIAWTVVAGATLNPGAVTDQIFTTGVGTINGTVTGIKTWKGSKALTVNGATATLTLNRATVVWTPANYADQINIASGGTLTVSNNTDITINPTVNFGYATPPMFGQNVKSNLADSTVTYNLNPGFAGNIFGADVNSTVSGAPSVTVNYSNFNLVVNGTGVSSADVACFWTPASVINGWTISGTAADKVRLNMGFASQTLTGLTFAGTLLGSNAAANGRVVYLSAFTYTGAASLISGVNGGYPLWYFVDPIRSDAAVFRWAAGSTPAGTSGFNAVLGFRPTIKTEKTGYAPKMRITPSALASRYPSKTIDTTAESTVALSHFYRDPTFMAASDGFLPFVDSLDSKTALNTIDWTADFRQKGWLGQSVTFTAAAAKKGLITHTASGAADANYINDTTGAADAALITVNETTKVIAAATGTLAWSAQRMYNALVNKWSSFAIEQNIAATSSGGSLDLADYTVDDSIHFVRGTTTDLLDQVKTTGIIESQANEIPVEDVNGSRASISGTDPQAFGVTWFLRWKKESESTWTTASGTGNSTQIVVDQDVYTVQARAPGYDWKTVTFDTTLSLALDLNLAYHVSANNTPQYTMVYDAVLEAIFDFDGTVNKVSVTNSTSGILSPGFAELYQATQRIQHIPALVWTWTSPVTANSTSQKILIPAGNPISMFLTDGSTNSVKITCPVIHADSGASADDRVRGNPSGYSIILGSPATAESAGLANQIISGLGGANYDAADHSLSVIKADQDLAKAVLDLVKTAVDAIKPRTDLIPDEPAAVGDAMTLTVAYDAAKNAASQASVDELVVDVAAVKTAVDAIEPTDVSSLATADQVAALGAPLQADAYTAPSNDDIAAIKAKTDTLVNTDTSGLATRADAVALSVQIGAPMQEDAYTAPPSPAAVASAVRTELSTELAHLDADVSSRSTLVAGDIPAGLTADQVWGHAARTLTVASGLTPTQEQALTDLQTEVGKLLKAADYTAPDTAAAIAAQVELAMLSDGDGRALLQAIADKIGNENLSASAVATAVWTAATRTLTSSNAPTAAQNAAAVRIELATELARVDVATSTRLASSGYTAPPTPPTVVQIRQEMDANSTKLANMDATVSSRLSATGYNAPPTVAAIRADIERPGGMLDKVPTLTEIEASTLAKANTPMTLAPAYDAAKTAASQISVDELPAAVRTELSVELGRIDVALSTRSTLQAEDIPKGLTAAEVWESPERTLTEAAGLTIEQAEILDGIVQKVTDLGSPLQAEEYTPPENEAILGVQTKIDAAFS